MKIAPGLTVGYVMGVGDEVPAGIAQLGVTVQMLNAQDLASADLGRFDAIMTGTRAYAVRDDLKTYNQRLLDYVKNGGNLIVLYNTPAEFDPNQFAPFPARLPRDAEEVSEEDSPVAISRRRGRSSPRRTRSRRPTSTAGSSSAARNSSASGTRLHADDRDARSGAAAAARRMDDGHATARATTPTSPTRSIVSCRTACRARTGCSPTCCRCRRENLDRGQVQVY